MDRPRVVCPFCKKPCAVRKDGSLRIHGQRRVDEAAGSPACPGSGRIYLADDHLKDAGRG